MDDETIDVSAFGEAVEAFTRTIMGGTPGGWSPTIDGEGDQERREMIPKTATLNVTKEEAESQLALYADLELTEREKKMMAIYDAVVAGDKVIDLDEVLERGNVRELTGSPRIALAPVEATKVIYTKHQEPTTRKIRRHTDRRALNFSYQADNGWRLDLQRRSYRSGWDNVTFFEGTANIPSVLPTARDKVEDGDLILWEPIWTDVTQRNESARRPLAYDPAVIRDIGNGLYRVVAAWDLTEVETRVLGA